MNSKHVLPKLLPFYLLNCTLYITIHDVVRVDHAHSFYFGPYFYVLFVDGLQDEFVLSFVKLALLVELNGPSLHYKCTTGTRFWSFLTMS